MFDDAVQFLLCILIDFADARARQNVMELVLQHHAPIRLEASGLPACSEHMRQRSDGFRGDQRPFGPAVLALDAALRRQRGAVQFEIDFAIPHRKVLFPSGAVCLLVIAFDGAPSRLRDSREIAQLHFALDHLRRDAAAAVAVTDGQKRSIVLRLAAEILPCRHVTIGLHEAVITLHRIVERMGQHPAAVEALPPEEIGGNMVGLAPVDLDREEAVDATLSQDLRQRAGKAEAVRQPADRMAGAEGLFEIALAIENLTGEAFAGRHVRVGLHPHAADGFPLSVHDLLLMRSRSAGSSSSICA